MEQWIWYRLPHRDEVLNTRHVLSICLREDGSRHLIDAELDNLSSIILASFDDRAGAARAYERLLRWLSVGHQLNGVRVFDITTCSSGVAE